MTYVGVMSFFADVELRCIGMAAGDPLTRHRKATESFHPTVLLSRPSPFTLSRLASRLLLCPISRPCCTIWAFAALTGKKSGRTVE